MAKIWTATMASGKDKDDKYGDSSVKLQDKDNIDKERSVRLV